MYLMLGCKFPLSPLNEIDHNRPRAKCAPTKGTTMRLNKEAFLAAALVLSVSACGSEAPEEEDTTGDETPYVAPEPTPQPPEPAYEPEPEPEPVSQPVDYAPTDE